MRPDDAVATKIEGLLGLELRLFSPVRRDAHHRSDRGRDRAGLGDLAAVEHVLQAIAQRPDIPRIVLHLVDDAVVFGGGHGDRGLRIGLAKRGECRLAGLQGPDDAVQTRDISHTFPLAVGSGRILSDRGAGLTMVEPAT